MIVLIAGGLVGIADVGHEIVGYLKLVFDVELIFLGRARHLYPAVGLPFIDGCETTSVVPECFHCSNPFYVNFDKMFNGQEDWRLASSSRLIVEVFRVIIVHNITFLLFTGAKVRKK